LRETKIHRSDACNRARPETHQNLIHTYKDRTSQQSADRGDVTATRTRISPERAPNCFLLYGTDHSHGGDDRDRTDDPLLAKQVLSQLSYAPSRKTGLCPDPQGTSRSLDPIRWFPKATRTFHGGLWWGPRGKAPDLAWWAREDLNLRPHAYQACALTS
jgi:hypothetical protein